LVVGLVLYDPTAPRRWTSPPDSARPQPTIHDPTKFNIYLAINTIAPVRGVKNDFFALMPSKWGRGQPHTVRQDDIFFFSEYRSDYGAATTNRRQ
jgi:hypothetical protein